MAFDVETDDLLEGVIVTKEFEGSIKLELTFTDQYEDQYTGSLTMRLERKDREKLVKALDIEW